MRGRLDGLSFLSGRLYTLGEEPEKFLCLSRLCPLPADWSSSFTEKGWAAHSVSAQRYPQL